MELEKLHDGHGGAVRTHTVDSPRPWKRLYGITNIFTQAFSQVRLSRLMASKYALADEPVAAL